MTSPIIAFIDTAPVTGYSPGPGLARLGWPVHTRTEGIEQLSSDRGEPVVEVVGFNPQLAGELRAEQRAADRQGRYGDKCHRGVDVSGRARPPPWSPASAES